MNIYEISRNYLQLIDELQEQGGELTPELENALKINEQDFENKAEAYCKVIINLNAEIDGLNNECVRLAEKRDRAKKAVERLKDNLTNAMLLFNYEKKSVGTFSLSFRKSEQVIIDDAEVILIGNPEFIRIKKEVDKSEIKKALKSGSEISGARLIINKNLQIK